MSWYNWKNKHAFDCASVSSRLLQIQALIMIKCCFLIFALSFLLCLFILVSLWRQMVSVVTLPYCLAQWCLRLRGSKEMHVKIKSLYFVFQYSLKTYAFPWFSSIYLGALICRVFWWFILGSFIHYL